MFRENFLEYARSTSGRWAKVFRQGFQNCILHGVQHNSLRKVIFSNCFKYFSLFSEIMFLPESSQLQFTWPEEYFGDIFPFGEKIFWSLRKKNSQHMPEFLSTCPGDLFGRISLRALRGKSSAVFSETAFFLNWRTFPENVVGVQPESFSILRKGFSTLSLKL